MTLLPAPFYRDKTEAHTVSSPEAPHFQAKWKHIGEGPQNHAHKSNEPDRRGKGERVEEHGVGGRQGGGRLQGTDARQAVEVMGKPCPVNRRERVQ